MSFRIAAARPEDCEDIFALVRALAEYEKLSDLVVGSADSLRNELFCDRPVIEAIVARDGERDGGRAIGFALFFHNFSTFLARRGLFLEDLFVVPEARGRGVGKALIRHGAQLAVQRGCGRYEWAVLDWNELAINFYRSIGANLLHDWRLCRLSGDALARFAASSAA